MKFHIRKLTKDDAREVNKLRKNAYDNAKGMIVKDDGIFWNRSDDQSTVLGVFNQDKLISTMRSEVVTSINIIESKMECPWVYGNVSFPAMILSKAAMNLSYMGRGLSSVLRLIFFQLAKDWKIKTILGTMTANSSRIESMRDIGYQFVENQNGWRDDNYRSLEKVLISILNFEIYGETALKKMEKKYAHFVNKQILTDLTSVHFREVKVVR